MNSLSDAIRNRRKSLRLTIDQVAERAELGYTTYQNLESNREGYTMHSLQQAAHALGCRIELRLVDERTGKTIE